METNVEPEALRVTKAAHLAIAKLLFGIIKKNPDVAGFLLGLDENEEPEDL